MKLVDANLRDIAVHLKCGKTIVFSTDTVYGLLADATNKKAVDRIFKIKERKKTKPFPVFVKDIKMAKKLAEINENQEKFLRKAWPGKITAVLKRKKSRLRLYGVHKKTIALRIPNHELLFSLVKQLNRPIVGTSANISGLPASTKIQEIINQFKDQKYQPDFIVDAGNLPKSRPSKVIDLTSEKPKILRQ